MAIFFLSNYYENRKDFMEENIKSLIKIKMKKSYEDTEIVINSVIEKIIRNESRRARLKGK